MLTTTFLLILIIFTYSVVGMSIFDDVPFGENINKDANFKSFYLSMITLVRCCTKDNWSGLMHDCYASKGVISTFYYISYMVFNADILVNVFVAVIFENFE